MNHEGYVTLPLTLPVTLPVTRPVLTGVITRRHQLDLVPNLFVPGSSLVQLHEAIIMASGGCPPHAPGLRPMHPNVDHESTCGCFKVIVHVTAHGLGLKRHELRRRLFVIPRVVASSGRPRCSGKAHLVVQGLYTTKILVL